MADHDDALSFTKPGVFHRAIRDGLIAQGKSLPTGYRHGADLERYVGQDRLDRAVIELHGGGRLTDDGRVYTDPEPGRARLAELAGDDLSDVGSPALRAYRRLAASPLGKIASSVTPAEVRGGPHVAPHRPRPIALRPDWVPAQPAPSPKLRRRLYEIRDALRILGRRTSPEGWSRIGQCGRAVVSKEGRVGVVVGTETGRAGYRGLARCGSVWECPTCMAAICQGRAGELERVCEEWHGLHRCAMLTLTVRHGAGQDLRTLVRGLSKAWRGFQRGKGWRAIKDRLGIVGTICAREVTHGPHGWHPHLHVVLLLKEPIPSRELLKTRETGPRRWVPDEEIGRLISRWQRMVWRYLTRPYLALSFARREGALAELAAAAGVELEDAAASLSGSPWRDPGRPRGYKLGTVDGRLWRAALSLGIDPHTPSDEHGLQAYECRRADYLAKLGLELTGQATKEGRKAGHRTPLQIAGEWTDQRSPTAARLWQEWCRSMKGSRQLTWSRGLKQAAGVVERTDDDLAEHEELGPGATELVGCIERQDWRRLQGRWIGGAAATAWVLEQVERAGAAALPHAVLAACRAPVRPPLLQPARAG